MPRPPNPQARDKILDAAFDLFHKKGYKGVSMDEIASIAGVKKSNLFYYYPSKEKLGVAVIDQRIKPAATTNASWKDEGSDPLGDVANIFEQAKTSNGRHGCPLGCLAQEISASSEVMRVGVSDCLENFRADLERMITEARSRGYFKKDLDSKDAARAIITLLQGASLISKAHKNTEYYDTARRVAVGFLAGFKT